MENLNLIKKEKKTVQHMITRLCNSGRGNIFGAESQKPMQPGLQKISACQGQAAG